MSFWRCFYHIIWATHNRQPAIDSALEAVLFKSIQHKSASTQSSILGINAVTDHIHIAVTMPPSISISDWVKLIKGVSSHEANEFLAAQDSRFRWQRGFGVLTFGERKLPFVLNYIERQKEHSPSWHDR